MTSQPRSFIHSSFFHSSLGLSSRHLPLPLPLTLISTTLSPSLDLLSPLLDLPLELSDLLGLLALVLLVLLLLLDLLPRPLALVLVGAAQRDVAGPEVAEEGLEGALDDPAPGVVEDHDGGHDELELVGELHQAHLLVDLGYELGRARERDSRHADDSVEHALVLREGLPEGPPLVVDGERRDLLD